MIKSLKKVRRILCVAVLFVLASFSGGLACTREEAKSADQAVEACVASTPFVECATKVTADCEHFACQEKEKLTLLALCLRVCGISPEGAAGGAGQGGSNG